MRRVYVKLDPSQLERLQKLADRHRRHPAAEAAVLLDEAMRKHEKPPTERREAVRC